MTPICAFPFPPHSTGSCGYWFNLFGPLLVWLRWRKKNSFIGKMAVRWAFLGTALNIITIVVYHMLF